jgi:hypothetical protein
MSACCVVPCPAAPFVPAAHTGFSAAPAIAVDDDAVPGAPALAGPLPASAGEVEEDAEEAEPLCCCEESDDGFRALVLLAFLLVFLFLPASSFFYENK